MEKKYEEEDQKKKKKKTPQNAYTLEIKMMIHIEMENNLPHQHV